MMEAYRVVSRHDHNHIWGIFDRRSDALAAIASGRLKRHCMSEYRGDELIVLPEEGERG